MTRAVTVLFSAAFILITGAAGAVRAETPALAPIPSLDEVRAAIIRTGAGWTAGDTPIARMTAEQRRRLIGGLTLRTDNPFRSNLAATLPAPPSKIDWRNNNGDYVTSVKYQAQCGACWAFASVAGLESQYMIAQSSPGLDLDLSEQIMIDCDSGNSGCNGGLLDTAADFLVQRGTYTESCYQFQGQDSSCSYACSEYSSGKKYFKVNSWVGVAQDATEMKTAVATYGPIVVGMIVCDDLANYYNGGVYKHASGSCPQSSGHAVLVVGYDDSQSAFIVKNSFDTSWGENGYFRIAYSEVTGDSTFGNNSVAYSGAYGTDDTVQVTVATQPSGLQISVDGTSFKAPKTFSWFPGSAHGVSVAGQKSSDGKTFYNFDHRSDGKAANDPITAPQSAGTVTFTFKTQYQLITQSDAKTGTVHPACVNGCWEDASGKVTLSATPAAGYVFAGWTGDVASSQNPYDLTMSKPMSVTGTFKVGTGTIYQIAASAGSGGTIEPSGTITVPAHGSQGFTMKPDTGYRVADVQVDGASIGAFTTYTFKDVTANHTIYVSFVSSVTPSFTITAAAGPGGTITPNGSVKVSKGDSQKFTIAPSAGHQVASVTVDGASAGKVTSYTFSNVQADHTIQAAFVAVGVPDGGVDAGGGTDTGGGGGGTATVRLTFTGEGRGSVSSDPEGLHCTDTCAAAFHVGAELTLTATPSKGATFGGWHWGSCGKATTCAFTVEGDTSLYPEFIGGGGGGGSDNPAGEAAPTENADQSGDTGGGCACSTLGL